MKRSPKSTFVAALVIALSSLALASSAFEYVVSIDAGAPNLTVSTDVESFFASATPADTYSAEVNADDQAFIAELEALGIAVD